VFCKVDIQLSSVSRLNANVAVGDPVEITKLESAVHEASQITLAALHPIVFASNIMFTLFTKEIMSKGYPLLNTKTSQRPGSSIPNPILNLYLSLD